MIRLFQYLVVCVILLLGEIAVVVIFFAYPYVVSRNSNVNYRYKILSGALRLLWRNTARNQKPQITGQGYIVTYSCYYEKRRRNYFC